MIFLAKKMFVSIILVIIALILVLSFLLLEDYLKKNALPYSPEKEQSVFVSKVIDGDTFELSNGYKVRIAGINAAEKGTACSSEATLFLSQLVEGKQVFLKYDELDQYGRILGYVFLQEKDKQTVNEKLVAEGLAHVYNPSDDFLEFFEFAEDNAIKAKKCLWKYSEQQYVTDSCISLKEFNFDAEGNDAENLNDEFIVFKNNCKYEIELTDWTIKDEATNTYFFNQFILFPEYQFTLYTGKGKDSVNELYWNSSDAVWNNSGDKLFLRNFEGELVLYNQYPSIEKN